MPMRLVRATGWASVRFFKFAVLSFGLVAIYIMIVSVGFPSISTLGSRMQSKFFPPLANVTADIIAADGKVMTVTYPAFRINSYVWEGDDLLMNGQLCKAQPYEFIGSWWGFGSFIGVWYEAQMVTRPPDREGVANQPRTRGLGCQFWTNWRLKNARNAPIQQFFGRFRYMPEHRSWMVYQTVGPFKIPPELPNDYELTLPIGTVVKPMEALVNPMELETAPNRQ